MPNILATSVSSLLAFQRALATTGHNIANANTEGYSRQEVELTARAPQAFGNGFFGRGVQVAGVSRIQDQFLNARVQEANSESQRLDTFHDLTGRIDNLLADTEGGLSPALQSFFNAVQDMANDPASTSARQVMLSESESLAGRFQYLDGQLDALNGDVNTRLRSYVEDTNSIAANIAKLNETIVSATGQAGGQPPNDLLDQRDQLIDQLSGLVAVRINVQDDGAANVFIGNGQPLVVGTQAQALTVTTDPRDPSQSQVAYDTGTGPVIIGDRLHGGKIGGALDFRREVLGGVSNELGRVALVLGDTFNAQHRQGVDLNGGLGSDFFNVASPEVISNKGNTGTATATATVTDATGITASDYRLDYDGTDFTLTRLSDNTSVSGAGPLTLDGFDVNMTAGAAAGDSFLVRPAGFAVGDFRVTIDSTNEIAAGAPVRGQAAVGNIGDAVINKLETLDATDPDLMDTVEIRFNNPPTDFDVVNVTDGATLAAGVAYTAGDDIDFNGVRVALSGNPQAGDTFAFERNVGGVSDNRNALALADLQAQDLVGGSSSYQDGYATLVGRVGSASRQAGINSEAQGRLLEQAQEQRDSVSGVNLDEEAVNLTRYQQAYQASAQVIAAADSLFQTLLSAVRR